MIDRMVGVIECTLNEEDIHSVVALMNILKLFEFKEQLLKKIQNHDHINCSMHLIIM